MKTSDFINKLLLEKKEFFTKNKAYILPDIPEKKLENIKKSHNLSETEQILWAVDTTLSGNATDSTIFTNYGIYFRQKILGQIEEKKILWSEIEQFFYDKKKGFVFLNKDGKQVVFERMEFDVYYKKDKDQIQAIVDVIEKITEFVRLKPVDVILTENEKKFSEDVKFMLDNDAEITENEASILEKMRQKYGIEKQRADEIIAIVTENYLSDDEKEYLVELKKILSENGEIDDENRRALDYFRDRLGISTEKAKKLEQLLKSEKL